jgi:hypothetical protein
MDINKENLEKSLTGDKLPEAKAESEAPKMSPEMEIGFHQGSINTLNGERFALIEMVQHVEARMQSHIKRLEELGVKIQTKKE